MPRSLRARLTDGGSVEFDPQQKAGVGAEKAVFFTPDRSQVVAFFLKPLRDREARSQRLRALLGPRNLTLGAKGGYWADYFLWPTGLIDGDRALPRQFLQAHGLAEPALGLVAKAIPPQFFFRDRTGEQRTKDGKWFTGNKARRLLPPEERGDLAGYLRVCIAMARAVRRMHFAGLAHADLSNKNVLIDPRTGAARLLDLDSLVVPGFAPPSVLGTPGYIAPEVVAGRGSPGIETDRHALAVLIYENLLVRHPLRGPKVYSAVSPEEDEALGMGERATFVEDEHDRSNRLYPPPAVPFTSLGPPLAALFRRAFSVGLRQPAQRPSADEWERALYQTVDLLHPVPESNDWMILAPGMPLRSPYTHAPLPAPVPFASFYCPHPRAPGEYQSEHHGLTIYAERILLPWQRRTRQWPNENAASREEQARFTRVDGHWYLTNTSGEPMQVVGGPTLGHRDRTEIRPGTQVLLSPEEGGRLAVFEFLGRDGA
ncbi:MAG: kinase [Gluconacetobacter diazotrophicus]|nr:kinase [Gluconacetobacter diazotrophicus]